MFTASNINMFKNRVEKKKLKQILSKMTVFFYFFDFQNLIRMHYKE